MHYQHNDYNKQLKPLASALRKTASPGERKLWQYALANSKMLGYRFRRQRAIENYIADFFCKELKLLIEVDGTYHDNQTERDAQRDARMKELGYETLRVKHYMVMTDVNNVAKAIENKVLELEELYGLKRKD